MWLLTKKFGYFHLINFSGDEFFGNGVSKIILTAN